jgi:hypothetical protein
MDSGFEAFISAAIAAAKQCIRQGEKRLKELQKFLSDLGFGEPSDPFVGVREPKKTAPTGGHLAVAVPEPEPESRVDAVAHR